MSLRIIAFSNELSMHEAAKTAIISFMVVVGGVWWSL